MSHAHLSHTTHTLEMRQLADLNACLEARSGRSGITADDLGLPGSATLVRVSWDGAPEYPYIYGHFADGSGSGSMVDLHTAALRALSHLLSQEHVWGTGSITS